MTFGALILAGGESSRIGEDKAFMKLGGKPLLLHVVERTLGSARETVVVIGKDCAQDKYRRILPPEVKITKDAVAGAGPLAGIAAGMREIRSEYAAVLPCDSPFILIDVLKLLSDRAREADAAIPRWTNGRIEPLHAIYRVPPAHAAAENAMSEGRLTIRDMISRLSRVVYVSVDEIRRIDSELLTFFNVNNREDLKSAAEILKPISI